MAIAAELKRHGIRANVVSPGAKTRLSTGQPYEEHIRDLHTRGLLDEFTMHASLDPPPPSYVAPLYAYLASDLSQQVTGQTFIAAGGSSGDSIAGHPPSSAIATTQTRPHGDHRVG